MAQEINIAPQLLSHNGVDKQIQVKYFMPWLNFLLALVAVSACLYMGLVIKTYNKEQKQTASLVLELQESLRKYQAPLTEQLPDNIAIVLQDLTNQISGQKHLTKDLESLVVSELRPQVAFLLKEFELGSRTRGTNLVAQTDLKGKYFLTKILGLAELYLSVLHDIITTDNLLAVAEQSLATNNDAMAVKLTAAIAKDRQALAMVKMPDKAKLWRSLDELHTNVAQYAYKKAKQNIDHTKHINITNKADNQMKDWRAALQNTWHELTAMIKVKRRNTNAESLATFTLACENLQRARLCLLLEQARAASFSDDAKVYHASIIAAKNILLTYFAANNALINNAIAELDLLAAINIQPNLPSHIYSFQALEAI